MSTDTDLFNLVDPTLSPTDPRRQVRMEDDEEELPDTLTDADEAMRIWREVVESKFPPDLSAYKGNRWRKEEQEYVLTGPPDREGVRPGILGAVTAHNWGVMVNNSLDKGLQGTFVQALMQTQPNGTWVPTACDIREENTPKNDRRAPYRGNAVKQTTAQSGVTMLENAPFETIVPVPIKILKGVVIWRDLAGREDIRYDDNGKRISRQDIRVESKDGALASALEKLADRLGATSDDKAEGDEPAAAAPSTAAAAPKKRNTEKVAEANRRRAAEANRRRAAEADERKKNASERQD